MARKIFKILYSYIQSKHANFIKKNKQGRQSRVLSWNPTVSILSLKNLPHLPSYFSKRKKEQQQQKKKPQNNLETLGHDVLTVFLSESEIKKWKKIAAIKISSPPIELRVLSNAGEMVLELKSVLENERFRNLQSRHRPGASGCPGGHLLGGDGGRGRGGDYTYKL